MLENRIFPEMFALGEKPAKHGTIDKERYSLATPAYGYGWLISRAELFEVLYGTPYAKSRKFLLLDINRTAESQIYAAWTKNGCSDNDYSPAIPRAIGMDKHYVFVYMCCNDTDEIMDDIMGNKKYHDACRESLGNPETLKLQPAWFRVGLLGMPKEFRDLGARES